MNYYPFHIGDYLSATRHLTWEEDAAFRRLLDVYYTTEKPLPVELRAVYRLVVASTDAHREAVENVLNEFFTLTDSGWVNSRADVEIAAMREKQQKQRDKANKRWHKPEPEPGNASAMPRHEGDDAAASDSDADAMPPTPTPTPTPKNKKPAPPAFVLPDWIPAEAWCGYEEMRKRKRAPMTPRARDLKVAELMRFKEAGHDIAAILDKSTSNGWTDIYEPKGGSANGSDRIGSFI